MELAEATPWSGPVDEIDRQLLELLRADARRSARSLAREVGMSPGAISERIARLEGSGAIIGYHAEIDPAALGFGMQVLVGLQTEQGPPLKDTLDILIAVPEVVAVHVVSGRWDLVVVLQVRDQSHLRVVLLEGLWGIPGFRHSESMLILESRTDGRPSSRVRSDTKA
jgi:DNA-binding Lrp family transcriptional regulator